MGQLMDFLKGDRALLEAIHGKSIIEQLEESVTIIRGNRSTTNKNVGTRFHRHGDRRMNVKESEVRWTPNYQSYFSAGDDSEPYCSSCDEELDTSWTFCPYCGRKLIAVYDEDSCL